MANWDWLDWVLVIIIVLSALTAIRKGFVAELISLASAIAALIIAALNYERLAPLLAGFTRSRGVALGVSFILIFFAVMVAGALVAVITGKLIRKVQLQWFDRFLGGIFGLARGLLVDCVLLLVMMTFAIQQAAMEKSVLAPYFTTGSRVIAMAMPDNMRQGFLTGFESFKKALIEADRKAMQARSASEAKH